MVEASHAVDRPVQAGPGVERDHHANLALGRVIEGRRPRVLLTEDVIGRLLVGQVDVAREALTPRGQITRAEALIARAAIDGERSADEALSLTENQYQAGTVSYLNVVVAQAAALNAKRSSLDIAGKRLLANTVLLKALGGDWKGEGGPGQQTPSDK